MPWPPFELVPNFAPSVVGGQEGTDDELAGPDRDDRSADILDDQEVLVPHRGWARGS